MRHPFGSGGQHQVACRGPGGGGSWFPGAAWWCLGDRGWLPWPGGGPVGQYCPVGPAQDGGAVAVEAGGPAHFVYQDVMVPPAVRVNISEVCDTAVLAVAEVV